MGLRNIKDQTLEDIVKAVKPSEKRSALLGKEVYKYGEKDFKELDVFQPSKYNKRYKVDDRIFVYI